MSPRDSFVELMDRVKRGDQDAAARVFYRFQDRLIALARSRLDKRVQRRVDPEDVVQSAYRSFFRRFVESGYGLKTWDELWALLTVITVSKSINRAEYHLAKRRSVAGEAHTGAREDRFDPLAHLEGREPTPQEAAILEETVEGLLREMKPEYRPIVELSLQGYTTEEIASKTDRGETTVRRQKRWIRERLIKMAADANDAP
jgi:RNA polymerase sigma-70 factor (ECF subfamily)